MSKKKNQNAAKGLIIGIILICLVLGYYYYLSNRGAKNRQEDDVKLTVVQEILMRNLDTYYPPTPREVVKYYGEIAQCLHNETYTEKEFQDLALKIQLLYDDELIENKTREQYLADLKNDIEQFKAQKVVISSFSLSSSTDVEEFSQDGYSWAELYCTFSLRQGTQLSSSKEVFLLRKDGIGHWKIYGWKIAEEEGEN